MWNVPTGSWVYTWLCASPTVCWVFPYVFCHMCKLKPAEPTKSLPTLIMMIITTYTGRQLSFRMRSSDILLPPLDTRWMFYSLLSSTRKGELILILHNTMSYPWLNVLFDFNQNQAYLQAQHQCVIGCHWHDIRVPLYYGKCKEFGTIASLLNVI